MSTVTVEEAQLRLKQLIDNLGPGEEVILTENNLPVAKLVGERSAHPERPAPGLGKGSILHISPDFDETPVEFKEYIE